MSNASDIPAEKRPFAFIREGRIVTGVFFHNAEWPAAIEYEQLRYCIADGEIVIFVQADGRLRCCILNTLGDAVVSLVSAKLVFEAPTNCVVDFCWSQVAHCWITINGRLAATTEPGPYVPPRVRVPVRTFTTIDYSARSEAALKTRRDKLAGWQPKGNKIRTDRAHVFQGLRDEVDQIRDLLELINSGKLYHYRGIASRLRMLICTSGSGAPLPLLQLAAAHVAAPLQVFTSPDNPLDPDDDATRMIGSAIHFEQTGAATNPLDLDVWLQLTWDRIDGKDRPNGEALRNIGDTLGSHFAVDIDLGVDAVRRATTKVGDQRYDWLLGILVRAAYVAMTLGERLLALEASAERATSASRRMEPRQD